MSYSAAAHIHGRDMPQRATNVAAAISAGRIDRSRDAELARTERFHFGPPLRLELARVAIQVAHVSRRAPILQIVFGEKVVEATIVGVADANKVVAAAVPL